MNRWLTLKRRKSRRNFRKSSRKRQKSTTLDKISALPDPILGTVDRISALPDPILGIILSFLPITKDAIATSVLSKRWRFMWKTVHNLVFFHWGLKEGDDIKFVESVNHVLHLHDPILLDKFMLFWKHRCNLDHLRSWIQTAITRNVQKLVLDVETCVGPHCRRPDPIEMPISVFSCESLRHLVLDGGIYFSEADVICLPRLERLELLNVDFESEYVFQKFVSGCPVLNFLHLHVDMRYRIEYFGRGAIDVDDDFTYVISSTSLKRLEASFRYKSDDRGAMFFCSLILETPSLEVLVLKGSIFEMKVRKSLSCLVEAFFEISDMDLHDGDTCNLIVEVVRAFDCAKFLDLSNDATWALSKAGISLSTEFKKLVKLEIGTICCHCCVPLRDFLQYSDNLEVLIINQVPRGDFHVHHTDWNAPVEVPICLSNNLKKVVFDVYCGNADEREVIRYMLKHGSVLEVVQIKCERETATFELVQEICKFPRKSRACEVEFSIDQSDWNEVETSTNPPSDWNGNLQMWLMCNATGGEYK